MKQELFTLPEHLSSPPIFSEVRVARSLVFNVMLCRPLFVLLSFFFWPLYCLFFFDLRLLITSLWYLLAIVLSVLLRFTASDYPFGIIWPLYCLFFFDLRLLITPLVSFGHCIVCSSSIYSFWLPPFGIFWPLYCLFFFDLRLVITPLVTIIDNMMR